jgi:hypothetical protein
MNHAWQISNLLPTGHLARGRGMGFDRVTRVMAMSSPAQAGDAAAK